MALRLLPDAEKIVIKYLRDQADVDALVGGRVYGTRPATSGTAAVPFPFVVVQRLSGGTLSTSEILDGALLQIDCWAAERQKAQAFALMQTVRAALGNDPDLFWGEHDDGIVTGTDERRHPGFFEDPNDKSARYSFDLVVYTTAGPLSIT